MPPPARVKWHSAEPTAWPNWLIEKVPDNGTERLGVGVWGADGRAGTVVCELPAAEAAVPG